MGILGRIYSRFNFIAVDHLVYTHEVLGNIRQSDRCGLGLCLAGNLAAAGTGALDATAAHLACTAPTRVVARIMLLMVLVSIGLNAEDRNQRANQYANELAGNGLFVRLVRLLSQRAGLSTLIRRIAAG